MEKRRRELLSSIPSIHEILEELKGEDDIPRDILHEATNRVLASLRKTFLSAKEEDLGDFSINKRDLLLGIQKEGKGMYRGLTPVINGTGVLLHTNLGRAPLSKEARERIAQYSASYLNLEYDLKKGERGSRYHHLKDILSLLCGTQDALLVNNNAAAVLLILDTLATGREVIVSRGELIEIGGSFRLPAIMKKARVKLVEVGTTNRTSIHDYEEAIGENTALILKSHQSNFRIKGYTREARIEELVVLAKEKNLPFYYDMGSGNLLPFPFEPTVKEVMAKGVHLLSFSGDKLLGGPQGGIIVGNKDLLSQLRKNPLTRALRVGKLTLIGLEETLRHYLNQEVEKIPIYKTLATSMEELEKRGDMIKEALQDKEDIHCSLVTLEGEIGGGSLPVTGIESRGLKITSWTSSARELKEKLLRNPIPVIGMVKEEALFLDLLTVHEDEIPVLIKVLKTL